MNMEQDVAPTVTEHLTGYARTVIIGDIHGDLDTLLASLADKRIIHYSGPVEKVVEIIETGLAEPFLADLEALVQPAETRLQLIFLGDYVDRWYLGYHVIQFLMKIRWKRFGIDAVFLMGNHEAHNLHFFLNPFRAYELYSESVFTTARRCEYIGDMGLVESLTSFMLLHGDEIRDLQKAFYAEGKLSWDLGYGTLLLEYPNDLSPVLAPFEAGDWDAVQDHCTRIAEVLGYNPSNQTQVEPEELFEQMGLLTNPEGQNYWSIDPPEEDGKVDWGRGYSPRLTRFNLFTRVREDDGREPIYSDVLPVDWRLISMVWRKHYGPFFKSLRQMHLEGDTLYLHGGLSPQVMLDSQGLGVYYRFSEGHFKQKDMHWDISNVVRRANRLASQVIANALADFSFSSMAGTEITDMMGVWRGENRGFTQFGGVYWADFEYLQRELEHERVMTMYEQFVDATEIRRIICGHTRFYAREDETRYLQIGAFEKLGLDYINVDNACSRGYRSDPVLNGIELDEKGRVLDQGRLVRSWWEER
ncbi:MAG: metallophosphoesterase [Acidobacteriota bacterium]|nr:metallophosphoesterase [Acidobacteriota bacterium]